VCNGGIGIGALALADDEPELAGEILRAGLESIQIAMAEFAPNGAWKEGPGYWNYATAYNVAFLAALETALGTDFGLAHIPGFADTGGFPVYLTGPLGRTFNYADGSDGAIRAAQMHWLACKFERPAYSDYQAKVASPSALDLIWFRPTAASSPAPDPPLDKYFRGVEVATFRSAWNDRDAVFVGFKAGDNKANHSNLDLGTFILDALGTRWALDLGADNYNMPGYFGKQRWTYYRMRAESHNTLVLNPGLLNLVGPRCRAAGFQSMRRRSSASLPSTSSRAMCIALRPWPLPMNRSSGPWPLGRFNAGPRRVRGSSLKAAVRTVFSSRAMCRSFWNRKLSRLTRFGRMFGLLLLSFVCNSTLAELAVTEAGQSKHRIVISAEATPSERYAAEELQNYLQRIGGVKLPIVTDSEASGSHQILLGDNASLRKLDAGIVLSKLGTDGFVLRTGPDRLIIAGGKPRGTLNGVYALLEERLGVRWFTSEVEIAPKLESIKLPDLNETRIPALQYREVFWTEMMRDADFAARHRLNGQHHKLAEKHGGRAAVYFPFVHSFDLLIPRELHKEHPEYFPLINGQRADGYVQRCLSNPDVLKLAIARVRQWIQEHPEATIISVSQNDTGKWCQCEPCKALDDAEGSPAASMIRFVNAIAEAIEADYPKVRIDTLAYQYTRKPPKTLRPRKNVIVRLCSIECCFAHPLESCPSQENQRFREDIVAWEPIAPSLYVWDYTPNFAHYQQPFPNFDALQANVRFFAKHGVKGLFEQGNYSAGGNGEMGPLRAYLLAKLLWNPDTDVRRHVEEFLQAYYGKAASRIHDYLEHLHRSVREEGYHAHIFEPPTVPYLSAEIMAEAENILNEAEALAENETFRFRVQVARLPVWYVKIAAKRVADYERTELVKQFLAAARKAGISHISESKSLDAWAKQMGQ